MQVDADLLRMIADLGLAGGFVFEWQDEWFKRTWNTMDHQLPAERRALWHDPWTNEQYFGLQAVEPADRAPARVLHRGTGAVRQVSATHDEAYLHLRVRLADAAAAGRTDLAVGFDVVPGGTGGLPGRPGSGPAADHAVTLTRGRSAQLWVRALNDPVALTSGGGSGGEWNPARLIVNGPFAAGGSRPASPAEYQDVGVLVGGSFDPASPGFDSRAAWRVAGDVVELRLPWAAVGMSDPSSRQALVASPGGDLSSVAVPAIGITVAAGGESVEADYSWESWNAVRWTARPKAGLARFAAAVQDVQERETRAHPER